MTDVVDSFDCSSLMDGDVAECDPVTAQRFLSKKSAAAVQFSLACQPFSDVVYSFVCLSFSK